ncbi:hypothetical protein [Catellatospora sp. IY07-71]|uniref:hypothetical protein n=1 Tax=Catellatospora sp. IY07-71 TaxID=2728827 RepID=UPI001BB3D605|nr:hypothetical protein [Catellatospora sp. IY07-71]
MSRTCATCGKKSYDTPERAIAVALRCSRLRGTALRVYHCPRHETWHLTSRATWRERPPEPPVAALGYRRRMAALLADRGSVGEQELVAAAASGVDPRHVRSLVTELLNIWCRRGLVYPDGPTVVAVDVPALGVIAAHGWSAWVREHPAGELPVPSPAIASEVLP